MGQKQAGRVNRYWNISLCALCLVFCGGALSAQERPRLLVLTDIGGDPDDQQSMIRLMVYANEFLIEGLVATASGTPGELKTATTRPDLIREIVLAYGEVRTNLVRHAQGWPETDALLKCIKSGNPNSCLKEGDTPSWFFFLPPGGNDPKDPSKPGWGGQYRKAPDGWYRDVHSKQDDPRKTVSRWRSDLQSDFARRMSWCQANGTLKR